MAGGRIFLRTYHGDPPLGSTRNQPIKPGPKLVARRPGSIVDVTVLEVKLRACRAPPELLAQECIPQAGAAKEVTQVIAAVLWVAL